MFDTICTFPLPADLFAQAVHPTEPILTVGLSSGHVISYRLPAGDEETGSDSNDNQPPQPLHASNGDGPTPIISNYRRSSSASENGLGSIDTRWKTKRHHGSCRCVTYSHDGSLCYSGGTDGLVKAFNSETGKVVSKIAIPSDSDGELDAPTVLHALSPQAMLLGTDSGKLYLHDLRRGGMEIQAAAVKSWQPHEVEHVNSLYPLPISDTSTSGFPKQWITVGGSTLVVTDLRKGIISTSEDQEAELTTAITVQGLKKGGTSVGEKVLVGQGDGIISLWERGVWGDQDERVVVDRTQSGIESMAEVPLGFGKGKVKMNEKLVAAGLEDGAIRFLRVGRNGVLSEWDIRHDEIEGVVGLDFDVAGRLVSGGGQVVKVWTEAKGMPGGGKQASKHAMDSDESDEQEEEDDSSDEEDKSRRKKRKRNKGKDKSGGQALTFSGVL